MSNVIRRCARWALGRRRRVLIVLGLTALVLLGAHPTAHATDVFSNINPAPQLPPGGWVGRYQLGNYELDEYFSAISVGFTSGVDASGVVPMIAYFGAEVLWEITLFLANGVILLFSLAFNLDLVNGNGAPGSGALTPISQAIHNLYSSTFGTPWLIAMVTLVGCWAMWKALIQRKYTEAAGSLAVSLLFFVLAIGIVTQPERTIGPASKLSNQLSTALLSLGSEGNISSESQAKTAASNQLFELLVLNPWTVLEFGGVEHCANVSHGKAHSVAVRPLGSNPASEPQLADQLEHGTEVSADGKTCINNRNKYAVHFLAYTPGSKERGEEHEALEHGDNGDLPDSDSGKTDGTYPLRPADEPAAEAMGKSGQIQRLLLSIVILLGEVGAYLLLGALAIGVILAQILLLTLLAFAPVALLIGIFPGRGHEFFRAWLAKLASYLARKVVYSLILAIVLAVCSALDDATSNLGWLLAFAIQAAFLWTIFLQRDRLTSDLMAGALGPRAARESTNRLQALYYTTRLARMFTGGGSGGGGGGGRTATKPDTPGPAPATQGEGSPPPSDEHPDGSGGGGPSTDPPDTGAPDPHAPPQSPGGGRPGPNETPTHGPGAPAGDASDPSASAHTDTDEPASTDVPGAPDYRAAGDALPSPASQVRAASRPPEDELPHPEPGGPTSEPSSGSSTRARENARYAESSSEAPSTPPRAGGSTTSTARTTPPSPVPPPAPEPVQAQPPVPAPPGPPAPPAVASSQPTESAESFTEQAQSPPPPPPAAPAIPTDEPVALLLRERYGASSADPPTQEEKPA